MLELKHTRLEHRTDCAVHGVKDLPMDPRMVPQRWELSSHVFAH